MTAILSVNAVALTKILQGLMPFTADELLPSLNGIEVARRGDRVTFAATDRFKLAITAEAAEWADGVAEDWNLILPVALCRSIVDSWKSSPRWWAVTIATEQAEEVAPGIVDVIVRDQSGRSVGYRADHGLEFPDLRKSLDSRPVSLDAPSDTTFGFNYDYLLAFQKLRRSKSDCIAIGWPEQPSHPVRLVIGHHTVGLIMPVRLTESLDVDEVLGGAK